MATATVSVSAKELLGVWWPRLDSAVQSYLSSIFEYGDFADVQEVEELVEPFLLEVGASGEEVRAQVAACTALAGLRRDGSGQNPSQLKLATPVSLHALGSALETAAVQRVNWMQAEATVNADRFERAAQERAPRKMKEEEKAPPPARSLPSSFVKRHRTGPAGTKQIVVRNLDVRVGGLTLIKDAQLSLSYGRKYGLVGRNGAGKSSLLKALAGGDLELPDIDLLLVEQEVVGDDTLALDSVLQADTLRASLLAEEATLLAAQPSNADEAAKRDAALSAVYAQLSAIDSDSAPATAASILAGLGFSTAMQQQPTKSFSGGWRMRLALARALFCQPDLLMLDEPTNMLDVQAVLWLEEYLAKKWKKTLLIVSHDREFLNYVVTDVVHLYNHQLVHYMGNYDQFEQTRNERLKQQARAHEAQEMHRKHVQKFIDRFRYNANRAAQVQSRIKALRKMAPVPSVVEDPSFAFSFPQPPPLAPPLIRFDDVAFGYEPGKRLLSGLTFNVDMESRVALVGANGQGKSTLLSLIGGSLEPTAGIITRNQRAHVAKFSQHHVDQLPLESTPLEFLMATFPNKEQSVYREALGRYGIKGDMVFQRIATLSGGQKSRLSFAYLAMQRPHLLLLDEPTNHLDVDTVAVLAEALNDYQGGVVLVSHDERLISLVCDQIWIVGGGRMVPYAYDFDHYKRSLLKDIQLSVGPS